MVIPYADNLRVGFFFIPWLFAWKRKLYGRVGGWMDFYSSGPIIQETTSLEQKVTQNQSLLLKKKILDGNKHLGNGYPYNRLFMTYIHVIIGTLKLYDPKTS